MSYQWHNVARGICGDNHYCDLKTANSTFLFGYSTDVDQSTVVEVKTIIINALIADPRRFVKFADVRFDVNGTGVINYHDDLARFSNSINRYPADKSLSVYPTDIVQVIDSFDYNTQIPKCGSTMLFLIRQHSLTRYYFSHFYKMQQEKIMVHCIQSANIFQNGWLGTMNDVSGNTGGIYAITGNRNYSDTSDPTFGEVATKIMGVPYHGNQIYSVYPGRLTQNLTYQIQNLIVPAYQQQYVNATLVITTRVDSGWSQSIELTVIDKQTHGKTKLFYDDKDYYDKSDVIWETIQLKSGTENYMFMDFQMSSADTGYVAIRIYIDETFLNPIN